MNTPRMVTGWARMSLQDLEKLHKEWAEYVSDCEGDVLTSTARYLIELTNYCHKRGVWSANRVSKGV